MRAVAGASLVALAAAASVAAEKPTFKPTDVKGALVEQFTDDWATRWTPSKATKKTPVGSETFSYVGEWKVEESSVRPAIIGDKGLVAKSKASHHAISAPLATPLDPKGKPFVVQYEAKFQKGGNCGGGYLKLLEEGFESSEFSDKTPWVVMFGQDLTCPGSKVHFIFRHQNPITKEWEEKHLKSAPAPHVGEDTNLYTLIVNPDNTFEILINNESNTKGNLLESFEPPVNPPKEIDDPEDKKPSDWVDEDKIADPAASKPEDWDEDAPREIPDEEASQPEGWLTEEPLTIPDPDAEKPEEWDDEEDGDWIAPTIPNPKCTEGPGCGTWVRPMKANPAYKGKWSAPLIDNPAYKGPWSPRKITNPNYFEDLHPANLNKIGGVGIEIWTMTEDILFDNIYVGSSPEDAAKLAKETFVVKQKVEKELAEAEKPKPEPSSEEAPPFAEQPVAFLRHKALQFVEAAKEDPVGAFKSQPETGAVLLAVLLTFLGSLGALFGVIGGSGVQKPATTPVPSKQKKKEVAADAAASAKTPVAPAGEEKQKQQGDVKKRAAAAK
ncbi:Calnexin homolog OS=Neosartorya fumigata (strain ATCC MYA-4609 / Af293 / CBS 101355 / FGSC A1100) GN=AFUA_4G12850 PE=2 SV=2 [Rhizoctonia solani AG-1 IB]|uniref:Calnexin n=1 Tax=Thanatephorus cucumeris (strain AG1-IB / isolate 7/3/14) TaxID=1108050 RepID=A0A0B7FDN5_THACB|nr:Calnexin homolog OS=Neosartorya fumigata (strain ATCC MYA-4609 / Af293 / CBS 101355 / FGSC A1100) GN=AFUA_4G12850 PE=2 SV=2 [Rhizoctonia solani AG-1 IB]